MTPEQLTIARKHYKRNQTQFGELLGVSSQSISNWESGRTPIPAYVDRILTLLAHIEKLSAA